MRAQVAKRADASLFEIGHPAPLGVEPAAERTQMTVRMTNTCNRAKAAFLNLITQEKRNEIAAHEIARLKQNACLFNRLSHRKGVFRAQTERLFGKNMFFGGGSLTHQRFVTIRLGADNH